MIPRATYRLQFHKEFTFHGAAEIADYLDSLGVSHIYCSPILKARADSHHGYDVIDHSVINPELGGEAGFRSMAARLRAHGIGIIVDIVPNHMAVGRADNSWWLDLLQNGQSSRFAQYFDIDWDAPGLEGKVFAPFLEASAFDALSNRTLKLEYDELSDRLAFTYNAHRFPVRPRDQNIQYKDRSLGDLRAILSRQNFVLADWREANSRINWRRFFAITELAALRPTRSEVFEAIHSKIFALYGEGLIDGVRVDHIDGIAEPALYCRMLRQRLESIRPGSYIVVEKILADDECIPASWQVDGTTGYDFMNDVSALQHVEDHEALESIWFERSEYKLDFESEELLARKEILKDKFSSQLNSTARAFHKLLPALGLNRLADTLCAIIANLRCYRTYANGRADTPGPGMFLKSALARASIGQVHLAESLRVVGAIFDHNDENPHIIDALRRFSQLSTSVAAKAVEDTAFYRYGRLISRNDVGFNPRHLSWSIAQFQERIASRAVRSPRTMTATATHDHKRGEDVRARLAVLSECPRTWQDFVSAFPPPTEVHREDAYFLFQTLIGSWPAEVDEDFAKRIENWCIKHLREANLRSSWTSPDDAYESKFRDYARRLILGSHFGSFRLAVARFVERIAASSRINSLVQLVLHCTAPGVVDIYQGCEFEDLSLTDPDNRHNVDYSARRAALETGSSVKQLWLMRLLNARKKDPDLWMVGDYQEILTEPYDNRLIGFSRSYAGSKLLVLGLLHTFSAPCRAEIVLDRCYTNLLTCEKITPARISLARVLGGNPAAVLHCPIDGFERKQLPAQHRRCEDATVMEICERAK